MQPQHGSDTGSVAGKGASLLETIGDKLSGGDTAGAAPAATPSAGVTGTTASATAPSRTMGDDRVIVEESPLVVDKTDDTR